MKFDLNNLDLNDAPNWPLPVKIGAAALAFGAIVAGGWYLDWNDQAARLEQVAKKENELKNVFEIKQKRAANLEAYQQQLEEMEASFGAMLRQLPSRAEISKLLVDISQTGLASGLEFELFRPGAEGKREFYAELPVSIRVKGNYHQLATFVSGVANLPRIVTLHDIAVSDAKNGQLAMNVTAKTYWYLDDGAKN